MKLRGKSKAIAESSLDADEKVKEIAAIVKDECLDAEVLYKLPTKKFNVEI